jgi:hypothetical protein
MQKIKNLITVSKGVLWLVKKNSAWKPQVHRALQNNQTELFSQKTNFFLKAVSRYRKLKIFVQIGIF